MLGLFVVLTVSLRGNNCFAVILSLHNTRRFFTTQEAEMMTEETGKQAIDNDASTLQEGLTSDLIPSCSYLCH